MKKINYFEVCIDHGRSTKILAAFEKESDAEDFSSSDYGRDRFKNKGRVIPRTLFLYESASEAGVATRNDLINQAKAKLTLQEREALGLEQ